MPLSSFHLFTDLQIFGSSASLLLFYVIRENKLYKLRVLPVLNKAKIGEVIWVSEGLFLAHHLSFGQSNSNVATFCIEMQQNNLRNETSWKVLACN